MRKWMLTLLIAIFALPFFGSSVLAEDTEKDLEDGTYENIDYVIKHETNDEVSKADQYFEKPATLTVEDGRKYIELKVTGSNMVKSVEVPSGFVEDISENEDDQTRIVGFEVEGDLSEPVEMKVHVVDPDFYDEVHTTRAFFEVNTEDEESLETEEEQNQDNEPGSQNPEEQPNDTGDQEVEEQPDENMENNEGIIGEGEYYTIDFDALHLDRDRPSAMAGYMVNPAFIENADGSIELTIAVANETVTKLELNDQDSVDSRVDGDTRYETFTFDSLPDELDGYVEYQAPLNGSMFESNADFILVLNNESLKEATENDKYAAKYVAPEIPEPEEEPVEEIPQVEEEPVTPDEVDPLSPDSAYEIDFIIKHKDKDEESAANRFFQSPGILLYQGEDIYLQFKVTGKQFIDALSTANGPVVIVEEGDDYVVVQLKVDDISDMILLDMILTVPGVYDNEEHSARLFLLENTMDEVDADNFRLVASPNQDNANGPWLGEEVDTEVLGNGGGSSNGEDNNETNENTETPEKPELGPGEDDNDDNTAGGQETNPKTGDTANIILYVLLLVGSAVPLAIQLKRRFV